MQIPTYILYEILIRLHALNPAVGEYMSYRLVGSDIRIRTTTGEIDLSEQFLDKQFHNPQTVTIKELKGLLNDFTLTQLPT